MEPTANEIVKIAGIRKIKKSSYHGRLMNANEKGVYAASEKPLAALAKSIKESGLPQPIIVNTSEGDRMYGIIDGHRRVSGRVVSGRGQIKAINRDCTEHEGQIMAAPAC